MSSFFTLPASQKKRKRSQVLERSTGAKGNAPRRREPRDESISGSDVSEDEASLDRGAEEYEGSSDEDEEFQNEDPAAKRIRLAEQYLANTQKEVLEDAVGFDAAEIDQENLRRRMGDRLKQDTAETKGKLYRWVAEELDWARAEQRMARMDGKSVTGVAVQGQHAYTVAKDGSLSKWALPDHEAPTRDGKQVGRPRHAPKRVRYARGDRKKSRDRDYIGHTGAIMCVAASQDGKFVATGGEDKRLVIWSAADLRPLKVFTQHRDAVTSLAFRRGTNQLFSASRDRTVKIWSLDELAYVETLFGHQDEVVDVDALAQEKCVTVGARDRTARHWKVVEESQLVFRGGGAPSIKSKTNAADRDSAISLPEQLQNSYNEGSIDRVACIDDETFVTGSDNGSLALWNINKKKAVFVLPLAHGVEEPLPAEMLSAEEVPEESVRGEPQPRWITALEALPFSDVFVSGSWDGCVRAWRISPDKRRIEALGVVGEVSAPDGSEGTGIGKPIVGVINDLSVTDRGERGKRGLLVAAAVGKDHRLGRWSKMHEGKNSLVLFEVPRQSQAAVEEEEVEAVDGAGRIVAEDEEFGGFD